MENTEKNIKVITNNYFMSNPTFSYTISINNIEIKLTKDDFDVLLSELSETISKDLEIAKEYAKRNEDKSKKLKDLINGVRKCLYHGNDFDDDDFFILKDTKDIDDKGLEEAIQKLDRILGFE